MHEQFDHAFSSPTVCRAVAACPKNHVVAGCGRIVETPLLRPAFLRAVHGDREQSSDHLSLVSRLVAIDELRLSLIRYFTDEGGLLGEACLEPLNLHFLSYDGRFQLLLLLSLFPNLTVLFEELVE